MKFRPAIVVVATAALVAVGPAAASGAPRVPASSDLAAVPALRVGTTYVLDTLDPTKSGGGGVVNQLALETLFQLGPQEQLEPELATSWSQTSPLTYVYHLRHGVTFWDGQPFTSADVVYSYNYERAPGSQDNYGFTSVKSVTAAGPYTVVVTLNHPDASWKYTPAYNGDIFEAKFAEAHKGTFGQPGVLGHGNRPVGSRQLRPNHGLRGVGQSPLVGRESADPAHQFQVLCQRH